MGVCNTVGTQNKHAATLHTDVFAKLGPTAHCLACTSPIPQRYKCLINGT